MPVLAIAAAAAVGFAAAAQTSILGGASRSLHPLAISFALQAGGALLGLAWVVWSRNWSDVTTVVTSWWWLPLALVGLGVVASLGFAGARLGAFTTLLIVVAAQLVGGLALDLARGELELDVRQPLGIGLVLVGVVLASGRE